MKLGSWIFALLLVCWITSCELKPEYKIENAGYRPAIAKLWCGSPTCLDAKP